MVSANDFYFLEVNTRIQVEHPITEATTGIDIVKEQILVAAGHKLSFTQEEVSQRGHAIECRINAEDPAKNFMPSPGTLARYDLPQHPWVRVDTACYPGYTVLPFYDSLLAKLVVWGRTREEAINRTKVALNNFKIEGVQTTIPFHLAMLDDPNFQAGEIYTTYVEQDLMKRINLKSEAKAEDKSAPAAGAAVSAIERSDTRSFEVGVNQKVFKVAVTELLDPAREPARVRVTASASAGGGGKGKALAKIDARERSTVSATATRGELKSTMHGLVKEIMVQVGAAVKSGQKMMIFEAMKMESEIIADRDGKVMEIKVKPGQTVDAHTLLLTIGD